MPEFQGWLKKSPINMDKAFCGPCQSELRAHFTDLRTHAKSRKHLKVMEDKNSQKSAASIFRKQIAPLSNAEVERTFSATSHVKWWRRAQMKKRPFGK